MYCWILFRLWTKAFMHSRGQTEFPTQLNFKQEFARIPICISNRNWPPSIRIKVILGIMSTKRLLILSQKFIAQSLLIVLLLAIILSVLKA